MPLMKLPIPWVSPDGHRLLRLLHGGVHPRIILPSWQVAIPRILADRHRLRRLLHWRLHPRIILSTDWVAIARILPDWRRLHSRVILGCLCGLLCWLSRRIAVVLVVELFPRHTSHGLLLDDTLFWSHLRLRKPVLRPLRVYILVALSSVLHIISIVLPLSVALLILLLLAVAVRLLALLLIRVILPTDLPRLILRIASIVLLVVALLNRSLLLLPIVGSLRRLVSRVLIVGHGGEAERRSSRLM